MELLSLVGAGSDWQFVCLSGAGLKAVDRRANRFSPTAGFGAPNQRGHPGTDFGAREQRRDLGQRPVPESKGGTLGRFTLRGQVVVSCGFRVQAEAARRYRLQLSEPLQKQSWLELESDEQGRFEIGNLPVETLLKLEVLSTNPAQVPLQLWFALPAGQAQSLQERNLDLASSAEGLLLKSLLLQTSELLQFVQAARSQTYLQAQAQMATLLLKHTFQVSALELICFCPDPCSLSNSFGERETGLNRPFRIHLYRLRRLPHCRNCCFRPLNRAALLLGSAIPLRFQLSKAHPEPVSVVFYANGEPLKNALGQPLVLMIPAFSTTSQAVDGLLPSANVGEWQLEARLLNVQGETLKRVSGPRISLYSGGGGASRGPALPA